MLKCLSQLSRQAFLIIFMCVKHKIKKGNEEIKNMSPSNGQNKNSGKQSFFMAVALLLCCAIIISIVDKKHKEYDLSKSNNTYSNSVKAASSTSLVSNTSAATGSAVSSGSAITTDEVRGVWISYLSYSNKGYTKNSFTNYINKVFKKCKSNGYNTVFVHVRMFSDAMYPSKYFPWSVYSSGKAGKSPGFDPLKIMVTRAHNMGLSIHAWLNPYRISSSTTNINSLPKKSYAYKWAKSSSASKRRNVLKFGNGLYYNPAKADVRNLITKGVKEIVQNYNVDGIHFDDYFYPNLGSKYKKIFDRHEYNLYVKQQKKKGKKYYGIVNWRRKNVDLLISSVYKTVKSTKNNVVFGVSPAGNLDNLYLNWSYYCDVKKWMKSDKYIDYICPQIYWTFTHKVCPFKKTCLRWAKLPRNKNVKLYIGLAGYRAGLSKSQATAVSDIGWSKSNTILKREVEYGRKTKKVSGYVLFSYEDLNRKAASKEIANLKKIFK